MKIIPEEDKQKAIRLYKSKYKIEEISNLTGMHVATLTKLFRQKFEEGILTPRRNHSALKPRTPNGQGHKRTPTGIGKGGRNKERKKFTDEQEAQIAEDYYKLDMGLSQLKQKWGIHPVQLQRIRNRFKDIYGIKGNAPNYYKQKYGIEQKAQKGVEQK